MLAFPASNWDRAFAATGAMRGAKHAAFGRIASQITPRLYLSDYWTARDGEKLDALGITHVISVIDITPELPEVVPTENRMHIQVHDEPDADLLQHLQSTTAFIIAALAENKTNKVLVHCMMGVSRSATVVCAYLVATTDMTALRTITHVQSIRGIVRPNTGFRRQLEQYSTHFVKTKPKPPQLLVMPDGLKLPSLASRIRKLKGLDSGSDSKSKVSKKI